MKINWRKTFRTDRSSLLWGGVASLLVSIFLFYLELSKPVIKGKNDLLIIKGPFQEYSWVRRGRGSRLTFRLQNYNNTFQIAADFYRVLEREKFKSIPYGDTIVIGISRVFQNYLNTGRKLLLVYSVEGVKEIYLSDKDAIRIYNSPLMKFAAGLFFLIGVAALYYRHKYFPSGVKKVDAF